MANVDNSYNYQKAILHKLAEPSSVAATPDIGEITLARAAAQGKTAVQDSALAKDTAFAKETLAERDRQFYQKLDLDREMLDTWEKQNKWATAIALGNLAVTGLSIPAALKSQERQEASIADIVKEKKKHVAASVQGNKNLADAVERITTMRNIGAADEATDRRGY